MIRHTLALGALCLVAACATQTGGPQDTATRAAPPELPEQLAPTREAS